VPLLIADVATLMARPCDLDGCNDCWLSRLELMTRFDGTAAVAAAKQPWNSGRQDYLARLRHYRYHLEAELLSLPDTLTGADDRGSA
jgi:hypothetical protein